MAEATKVGFQLASSLASKHLTDAEFIKGGYFVVEAVADLPNYTVAKAGEDGTIVEGSLCYCQDKGKFYQYNGTTWAEVSLGSSGGEVTVGSTIAGFTVGDKYLTSNITKASMDSTVAHGVYIGTDGILVGHNLASKDGVYYYPGVKIENSTGKLTANNVDITGKVIAESGKIADCVINGKALYNKYTRTIDDKTYNYYMDSINTVSESYGMTDAESEFVYVGDDGVGTIKCTSLDGEYNDDYSWSYSYMSAGKLVSNNAEITGGEISNATLDQCTINNSVFNGVFNGSISGGKLATTITVSTFGLSDEVYPQNGTWGLSPHNTMVGYESISTDDGKLLSGTGTAPILLFAGNTNKNTISTCTDADQNTAGTRFYVTQSGFVRASSLVCTGDADGNNAIIGVKTDSYHTTIEAGSFAIRTIGTGSLNGNVFTVSPYIIKWQNYLGQTVAKIQANALSSTPNMQISGKWDFSPGADNRVCVAIPTTDIGIFEEGNCVAYTSGDYSYIDIAKALILLGGTLDK